MTKHYLGGHTIVGRDSGWFTGVTSRPVGDDKKPWVPKKPKSAPVAKKPVAETKMSKAATEDQLRLAFLHSILDAHFLKKEVPNAPKRIRASIEPKVQRAGDPLRWARTQPEFDKILLKKRKKYKAELPPLPPKPGEAISVPVADVPVSTRMEILREDRKRIEMRREAALNILRHCESQLATIEAELGKLGHP